MTRVLLGVMALLFLFSGSTVYASNRGVVGIVTFLDGTVHRQIGGSGSWVSVALSDSLNQGDRIKTGANTKFEAKLKDQSILRLGSSSNLSLTRFDVAKRKRYKRISLKLWVGRVWSSVTRLLGKSSFEIETNNAVAGVRGTVFSASQTKDGETLVKVYGGKVLVSNKPVYAVRGHTKDNRVVVPGPQEVTQKQWEELIAGAMQVIRVASTGKISKPESFALATVGLDAEWETWNTQRDKRAGFEH